MRKPFNLQIVKIVKHKCFTIKKRIASIYYERMVRAVYAMMQNYLEDDNSIVAYTSSGDPLTKEEYIKSVTTAYEEAKQGDVRSSEDLRNEVEKWGDEEI